MRSNFVYLQSKQKPLKDVCTLEFGMKRANLTKTTVTLAYAWATTWLDALWCFVFLVRMSATHPPGMPWGHAVMATFRKQYKACSCLCQYEYIELDSVLIGKAKYCSADVLLFKERLTDWLIIQWPFPYRTGETVICWSVDWFIGWLINGRCLIKLQKTFQ